MGFYNGPVYFASTAKELYDNYPGTRGVDGYYLLYIDRSITGRQALVYCDMTTDGGGWMLVARSHPSVVNYGGQNWGWRGGAIGDVQDFSQAYQAGWYTTWNGTATFTSFLFGNRANYYNNNWGPFIYKVSNINYSNFFNNDTQQDYTKSTIKYDLSVYGTTDYPGMQGQVGYTTSATNSNFYYMRDCCGFAGYGGFATQMFTVYCGYNFYYSGPWCSGASTDANGNFLSSPYVSNGLTFGGTSQYMIFVK